MKLDRRDCLKLSAVAGSGVLLSGCSNILRHVAKPEPPKSVALPQGDVQPVTRVLNRVAFGPRPGDIARISQMSIPAYLEEQLQPDGHEDQFLRMRLTGMEAFEIDASELRDLPEHEVLRQMEQAAILRAVYSRHQLRERMVDFWTKHFNIYANKGYGAYLKPTDELKVIREHALGSFPALLRASAHSPAMLSYLDNQLNRKRDPKTKSGSNENYAREIMELHTLGVHGGYTQKDVMELARCITGWTVEDRGIFERLAAKDRKRPGAFRFDPSRHDCGPKVVLGKHIQPLADPAAPVVYKGREMPAGQAEGEEVLDMLAMHPSTAKFIASKLCRYFLGDDAEKWTDRTAETYLKTDGDIASMLRPMLLSEELLKSPPILKRPFDYMVSSLRALSADTDANKALQAQLTKMGQPLYQWPMPDGYPDKTSAWTGSLLARWNFAVALMTGGIGGTSVDIPSLLKLAKAETDTQSADTLIETTLGWRADSEASQTLREKLVSHADSVRSKGDTKRNAPVEMAALLLASPEFQWR